MMIFICFFKYPPRVSNLFKVIGKANRRNDTLSTFQPRETLTIITSYQGQYVLFKSKYGSRDWSMYVNYLNASMKTFLMTVNAFQIGL